MDKVLNKFGIYDLIAVLLSGLIITSISIIVFNLAGISTSVFNNIGIDKTVLFLIGSYIVGLTAQELGSVLDKYVFFRNNKMLIKALRTSIGKGKQINLKSHIYMSEREKAEVYKYVIIKMHLAHPNSLNLDNSNDIIGFIENHTCGRKDIYLNHIYHYCKYYLLKAGVTSNLDKDQSISALCRSLCFYFFVLSFSSLCYVCYILYTQKNIPELFVLIFLLSLFLFFVFFHKFQRHAQIRHIFVFRWFYYNVVIVEKKQKSVLKIVALRNKSIRNWHK